MADAQRSEGVASRTLASLAAAARERDGLSIGEVIDEMGPSGFGFVILLLAIPPLIPIPGPFGAIFGTALAIISLQFVFGARSPWLPAILRNRRLSGKVFESMERHAGPMVRQVEKLIRPQRMKALAGRFLPCLLGVPVFALAIVIALPIPFGNIAPAVAICVMAVGLIERDGLVILGGLALTAVAAVATVFLFRGAATLIAAA